MPDIYTISPIAPDVGGGTAVDAINSSFSEAQIALNDLSYRLSLMNDKSALVQHYVPITNTVAQGDLVYWNATTGSYDRAQALLQAIPGTQGQSIEAPCARVEGLVIQIDTSSVPHTATILRGGCYTNASVAASVLANVTKVSPEQDDENTTPIQTTTDWPSGVYYLSPTAPGKVTADPGSNLRQPVLVYHGGNQISLTLFYMAHDNHFHATYNIPTWTSTSGGAYTALLPESFGAATSNTAAVFMSGSLNTSSFTFPIMTSGATQQEIVFSGAAAPTSGSVVVFNHFPFAYGSPVVRAVRSTNANLAVEMANGLVTLTANDFTIEEGTATGTAIGSISGGTATTTPVVTQITGGDGIIVTPDTTTGGVEISRSDLVGNPVDPDLVNHNGTAMTGVPAGQGNISMQCITFIASRVADVVLQKTVTDIPANTTAYVCGSLVGSGTDTLTVNMAFAPQPTSGGQVAVSSIEELTNPTTMTLAGGGGQITYAQTSAGLSLSGTGVLMAKVAMTNAPTANRYFLRLGFKLQAADNGTTA